MRRALLLLTLLAGLGVATPVARAFTLYGEIPAWFTDNAGRFPGDIYGPMNIGEEYRISVPAIFYGFDESFINYFGQRGIEEVEKAIKMLNDLPRMSEVKLSDYPMFAQRVNYRARDLNLLDLKSWALKVVMEELGLASPQRFTFTLRGRDPQQFITNYLVIMRNFDPETWAPTPYVNGQLWTYTTIYDNQNGTVKASTVPEPVDPLILAEPTTTLNNGFAPMLFGQGSFVTGFTRDDIGGLYYIYRPENQNMETLPADALTGVTTIGGGGTVVSGSGGGSAGSWTPIQSTNNVPGVAEGTAGEWTPIQVPSTNNPTTGTPTTGNGPISVALRGGIDKLVFTRGPSVIANGSYALAHRYRENIVVMTNGLSIAVQQQITRILTAPDILFTAQDLADTDTTTAVSDRTESATSNDTINGNVVLDGPGQISGPMAIGFNKVGPAVLNTYVGFVGEANPTVTDFVWGSFDGTTNEPIVYPQGTTIRDVERNVFGNR